ncbi:MAG TPA: restriction endonuclease subunit S, partial [Ignavibacteriales bacterium]|nr:restriction endonuclease subunit S [Ignavibacteriales bacterium]
MNKYPKYKLAGVEWIGDIPEHWEVERTKWVFSESKLRNRELKYVDEDLLSVSEYYGVAKRREIIDNNDILNRAESLSENKIVIKGELVINIMLAWKKGLGISDHNGIVSPSYCVFKLLVDKGDPKFFHYLYRTNLYAEVFRQNSRGIIDSRLRLYPEEFFNIITIVPSPEEQTAIANFLDEKTA